MFGEISLEDKEKAIQYLMENIPKDCLEKVWIAVQNKEAFWSWSVNLKADIIGAACLGCFMVYAYYRSSSKRGMESQKENRMN